jgi:[ribosomal protein S5]-alanine N-acetyltransferase
MKTILTTPRLQLREFVAEDANALARVICDPQTMQFYPTRFQRSDADQWIERNLRRYESDGHGLWAMVLKETGEVIGDCGVTLQEVDEERLPEIGYHLRRDQWGHGFATEAAQACRDWAFTHLRTGFLISLIRPENIASWRVAERNGMTVWKRVVRAGLPDEVYRIDREAWEKE